MTKLEIKGNIKHIPNYTFKGYPLLTEIIQRKTIETMGLNVFDGINKLTIKENIKKLPSNSFKGCNSLTELTILSAISTIGSTAFDRCTSLTKISLPSSIEIIEFGSFGHFLNWQIKR